MQTVKVQRAVLLARVRKNRDEHRAQFEKALDDFREAVILELEEWLERAKKGDKVERRTRLIQPEDHTGEYNRVIDMLEMSVDDDIELTAYDFAQYVRNEWAWADQFASTITSNSAYIASKKR